MPDFNANKRTINRNGRRYQVWDEYPYRDETPSVDGWDFWGAYERAEWEPHLEQTLSEHLTPNSTFLDIGAWIGPVSLIAARMCSQVHAVEPDPVARERLVANLGLTRKKNITVHPCALAGESGTVRIGHRADKHFGDSMTSTIFGGDAVEVPAVTLSEFVNTNKITNVGLVKMDIEGGEETALPTAAPELRRLGAPLLLATHAMLVNDPDRYQQAISDALTGFDVTILSGRPDGLATLLAVPR